MYWGRSFKVEAICNLSNSVSMNRVVWKSWVPIVVSGVEVPCPDKNIVDVKLYVSKVVNCCLVFIGVNI